MSLKEKATAFLMGRMGKTAHVRQITALDHRLLQLELQLPDPLSWCSCQHLKCQVGATAFRDYSIAHYNTNTQVATLLIDAGHIGKGSQWLRQLAPGDPVLYAGPGGGMHQPTSAVQLVCIADASAIGHMLSLFHRRHPEQGFHTLAIGEDPLPKQVMGMPLHFSDGQEKDVLNWLDQLQLPLHDTTFYVAGYIPMVVQTRKLLKQLGWKQVKAAGFWE